MLIVVATASKANEIHYLNNESMVKLDNQFVFKDRKIHKGWKNGNSSPIVTFHAYGKNPVLHIVKYIDEYLLRLNSWCTEEKTQLLLALSLLTNKLLVGRFLNGLETL